jgi:localization factor PodJL
MPDSTSLPRFPAVLRNLTGRESEQGTDAPLSTTPRRPSAAVNGSTRPLPSLYGRIARAEQVGTRWRDIQWVDFTSDPDSGAAASEPDPVPAAEVPEAAKIPEGDGALLHFRKSPGAMIEPTADAIPGLATRFTRLSVPRLSPVPRPPVTVPEPLPPRPEPVTAPIAALAATPRIASGGLVIPPRMPAAAGAMKAPARPLPLVEPQPLDAEPEEEAAPEEETGRPFPASILTHVSTAPEVDERAPPDRWLVVLATGVERAAALRRGVLAAMGTALARGRDRSHVVLHRLRSRDAATAPTRRGTIIARAGHAVDFVSRYVATRKHRLRVSGLAALTVVVVALTAYGGGALLAKLSRAGTSGADSTIARTANAGPGDTGAGGDNAKPAAPAANPPSTASDPSQAAALTPPMSPPADPAGRAAFYRARAKAGDAAAQYDLGVLYARGDGLVQDYATAASWFRAAATQGNVAAQYNLGVLYADGLGVTGDQTAALNWYRSAADQNHPGAQFNLALAYAQGVGAKQDFAAAARWYQRAAQQGLGPAMVNLAILYEQGSGIARSPIDAYAWYAAASEHGEPQAKRRADELFQQFNDRDKASAQGLAATIGAAIDAANPPASSPGNSAENPSRPPA